MSVRTLVNVQDWGNFAQIMGVAIGTAGAVAGGGRALEF
jgi:hypothetical protein